ncbi:MULTISPECIES: c-type cytochrome [unclassified Desulfovibrio]|uniref:c-type cytochrome n=1 Tax=unclassified Desulfovibrio TaxID=2593640 RepID=UPI002FDA9FCD
MKNYLQYGAFALAAALLLSGIQPATAQDAEQDGAKLYTALCASCHTPTPAKMMGKPVDGLVAGMEKVKNMESPTGPLIKMKAVLTPLTEAQIKNIAEYLNQLK